MPVHLGTVAKLAKLRKLATAPGLASAANMATVHQN